MSVSLVSVFLKCLSTISFISFHLFFFCFFNNSNKNNNLLYNCYISSISSYSNSRVFVCPCVHHPKLTFWLRYKQFPPTFLYILLFFFFFFFFFFWKFVNVFIHLLLFCFANLFGAVLLWWLRVTHVTFILVDSIYILYIYNTIIQIITITISVIVLNSLVGMSWCCRLTLARIDSKAKVSKCPYVREDVMHMSLAVRPQKEQVQAVVFFFFSRYETNRNVTDNRRKKGIEETTF